MFRMLRLKPPNGWSAVAWELAIVALGVLIALGAQQWAEDRSWQAKARVTKISLKEELAKHYAWSLEWRVVQPCIAAQIDRLRNRLMASKSVLDPAPVYAEPDSAYVLRLPYKDYVESVWQGSISDGVAPHLDPALRGALSQHYTQARALADVTAKNASDYQRLLSLSRPLPLDPMVRYSLLQLLDELRGRTEFMDGVSGQLIDHITKVGMVPPTDQSLFQVKRFGTYKFCRAQGLPLRPFAQAMKPVAN